MDIFRSQKRKIIYEEYLNSYAKIYIVTFIVYIVVRKNIFEKIILL